LLEGVRGIAGARVFWQGVRCQRILRGEVSVTGGIASGRGVAVVKG